jgi:hypothetical protein
MSDGFEPDDEPEEISDHGEGDDDGGPVPRYLTAPDAEPVDDDEAEQIGDDGEAEPEPIPDAAEEDDAEPEQPVDNGEPDDDVDEILDPDEVDDADLDESEIEVVEDMEEPPDWDDGSGPPKFGPEETSETT